MKIDKAIEILDAHLCRSRRWSNQALDDALRMGIEALKVIDAMRHDAFYDGTEQLPRETKE